MRVWRNDRLQTRLPAGPDPPAIASVRISASAERTRLSFRVVRCR